MQTWGAKLTARDYKIVVSGTMATHEQQLVMHSLHETVQRVVTLSQLKLTEWPLSKPSCCTDNGCNRDYSLQTVSSRQHDD